MSNKKFFAGLFFAPTILALHYLTGWNWVMHVFGLLVFLITALMITSWAILRNKTASNILAVGSEKIRADLLDPLRRNISLSFSAAIVITLFLTGHPIIGLFGTFNAVVAAFIQNRLRKLVDPANV
jgi:hypothetical protein